MDEVLTLDGLHDVDGDLESKRLATSKATALSYCIELYILVVNSTYMYCSWRIFTLFKMLIIISAK